MEFVLQKQTRVRKNWKEYQFSLTDHSLSYYKVRNEDIYYVLLKLSQANKLKITIPLKECSIDADFTIDNCAFNINWGTRFDHIK